MVEAISVIELLWKMIEELIKGQGSQKKELFENHIEPLQNRVIEIHNDYVSGFEEVRFHLRENKKPPEELIEFLLARRRDYEYNREMTRALATELAKIRRAGLRNDNLAAVENYANAVLDYLSAPSLATSLTWYTRFIEQVRWNMEMGLDDVWKIEYMSGLPHQELLESVDYVLNHGLPSSFKDLSTAYANLRTRFL